MVRNPRQHRPTRPVPAAKHKYSAHNSQSANQANPKGIIFKRLGRIQFCDVVSKPNRTSQDE